MLYYNQSKAAEAAALLKKAGLRECKSRREYRRALATEPVGAFEVDGGFIYWGCARESTRIHIFNKLNDL